MEEKLREELRQLWLVEHEQEMRGEDFESQASALIHRILEEEPQRLLDLCDGHIGGLSDENLLEMARNETKDFVYMNISAGSYYYEDVGQGAKDPNTKKIEKIYADILAILGFDQKETKNLLEKASEYDYYEESPALEMLTLFEDENICAGLDWKFGLEDVEYNLNLVAKKFGMNPIREYPPYEEGQPLGYEALETVIAESEYSAVVIMDGDSMAVFLTDAEKAPFIKKELDRLEEFWDLDSVDILS